MSWRTVVISSRAKLDLKLGYLVVRTEEIKKIHLSEISVLLIESTAVSLTASLLNELAEHKIKVIFCDKKRNPQSELVSFYGCHDTSEKIRTQIKWGPFFKELVWTEIVRNKIFQQKELLLSLGLVQAELLNNYLNELEHNDASNREGHAAKVYFNALFGNDFTRSADTPVNAALNYGYGIILSIFNREIVSNGYLTQLGLFHNNIFNYFNFSSDLMEPFRPLIDKEVLIMQPQCFEREQKLKILDVLNQEIFIGSRTQNVTNAIKIYCKSVFDALNENELSLLRFYRNEL